MALDDGGGDGEPETGAALLQLGGEEGLSDVIQILTGDAAAAVPHGDDDQPPRRVIIADHHDLFPRRGESFQGVQDDVDQDLPQLLAAKPDCATWKELGAACFACGSCAISCPTCTCYDIYDKPDLDGQGGTRHRRWDTCLFRDFDRIAGEHHFRTDRAERVKNRFLDRKSVV